MGLVRRTYPCVLGFSHWCFVHELVGFLVKGTEFESNLCLHLDDTTPLCSWLFALLAL